MKLSFRRPSLGLMWRETFSCSAVIHFSCLRFELFVCSAALEWSINQGKMDRSNFISSLLWHLQPLIFACFQSKPIYHACVELYNIIYIKTPKAPFSSASVLFRKCCYRWCYDCVFLHKTSNVVLSTVTDFKHVQRGFICSRSVTTSKSL